MIFLISLTYYRCKVDCTYWIQHVCKFLLSNFRHLKFNSAQMRETWMLYNQVYYWLHYANCLNEHLCFGVHVCVCAACLCVCEWVHPVMYKCSFVVFFFVLFSAAEDPDQFMTLVCSQPGPPIWLIEKISTRMFYCCSTLTFHWDSDQVMCEYHLRIMFKELAVHTGGVCWDMFSAFWKVACTNCCDGDSLLVPLVHPSSDCSIFFKIGRILSHGYLQCGFLPLRI